MRRDLRTSSSPVLSGLCIWACRRDEVGSSQLDFSSALAARAVGCLRLESSARRAYQRRVDDACRAAERRKTVDLPLGQANPCSGAPQTFTIHRRAADDSPCAAKSPTAAEHSNWDSCKNTLFLCVARCGPPCVGLQCLPEHVEERHVFVALLAVPVLQWTAHLAEQALHHDLLRESRVTTLNSRSIFGRLQGRHGYSGQVAQQAYAPARCPAGQTDWITPRRPVFCC